MKYLFIILLISTILNNSYANEPFIAQLLEVKSSSLFTFEYNNKVFTCRIKGIYTLEDILEKSTNTTCKNKIKKYYLQHPYAKYIANKLFYKQQYYPLEFNEGECSINIKGTKRYAEVLLEEGLAITKMNNVNSKSSYYLKRSQTRARRDKKGVYSMNEFNSCIELFKGISKNPR